jgi:hypothetical protein
MCRRSLTIDISLDPKKSFFLLLAVIFFTVAGSSVQIFRFMLGRDYLFGLYPLFNLNSDTSIPSWYSSVTLLLCAVLLTLIFISKRKNAEPFASHWAALSVIFVYLSMDEGARIHEVIGDTLALKVTGVTSGFIHFTWVLFGIALVLIVGISYLRFLAHLPRKMAALFILAGSVYVGGALVMEMINGRYAELHGSQNLTYQMMSVVEESLEMSGVLIFIYALLSYMAAEASTFTLHVARDLTKSELRAG